ncbi:acyltransferase [Acidisoma sp. L85]|uniref:acyltransferase family protein n=1 Tax=Acidisoma sp. L85 TaxID=1641850 RepID=UPI00131B7BBE|nr:acyltransferase [Acidisoma sp. L85]
MNQSVSQRFIFLDYLRAIAAWAVVWDHILAGWRSEHGTRPRFVAAVDAYVLTPLGVIQHGGWLAVCLFFLISGFVITHVAAREGVAEFLVKRFFRIFPLLAIFVLLSIGLRPALWDTVGWASLLRNVTLVSWFSTPEVNYVGVAWTLVIEVQFYLLVALTHGRTLAPAGPGGQSGRARGNDCLLSAVWRRLLPLLRLNGAGRHDGVVGRLFRRHPVWHRDHPPILPARKHSYLISFAYACMVFVLFFHFNPRLRSGPVLRFLAASSFAVYLVHGVIGRAVFEAMALGG